LPLVFRLLRPGARDDTGSSASSSAPRSTPTMPANTQQVSKKRKFVADGVFRAELDEFLRRELGEDGYAG
jgi:hypothetical protein